MVSPLGFCKCSFKVEEAPLYSYFPWSFYHESCWIFSNSFSASIHMILEFLFITLLILWFTLTDFQILNDYSISGISFTWCWYIIISIYCWILFSNFLLRFLHLYYWNMIAYSSLLFFFNPAFFWFGCQVNEMGSIPSTSIFW